MLAPVGALPFLFGGVTPLEVLVAFVFLFLIALLSVAFGLAISSKMGSLRGALLVTLLVAVPLCAFSYVIFGPAMSAAAHELWDTIPEGPPVWLEINPQGQFLFLEGMAELPLTNPFADFLLREADAGASLRSAA